MDILQNLQNILGQGQSTAGNRASGSSDGPGALSGLLKPEVLGGLADALFSGKRSAGAAGARAQTNAGAGSGAGMLGGLLTSLLAGGAGSLFGQSADSPQAGYANTNQSYSAAPDPRERALRFIRALIYAAKADGHIDDREQAAITNQVAKLNIGAEGQRFIQQAMDEPLDPQRIAAGVTDGQEAAQLYALSCAAINVDHFMEKSYLDGLANALRIPGNVKAGIEAKLAGR